jgi:sulfite exporter TauE/SafE/copper chaperone CopZ
MHCHGCEHVVERAALKLPGVRRIKADYPTETVSVDFDAASTNLDAIRAAIENCGYRTKLLEDSARNGAFKRLAGLVLALAGLLLIIFFDTEWISQSGPPDITQHMDLGLIFLLGLLTGFHCVGMCGGFVLSYTADDARAGRRSYLSHLLYGAGKTLSYTTIGALFGFLGAFIAFTPFLRGVAGMFAGAFLIIFGLNMLGLFAPLRRFRFGLPAPLQAFIQKEARGRHHPFSIGLLNGLMIACGPLQAMYVMAAGTGSALEGAKMLFAFGLGTLPVLTAFGVLTTFISGAVTYRLLQTSGAIVVVLGAVMINRGLILTGFGYDLRSIMAALNKSNQSPTPTPQPAPSETLPAQPKQAAQASKEQQLNPSPQIRPEHQTIKMDVIRSGFSPNHFVLVKNAPVKWVIDGKQITTCNNRIIVPGLNLEFDVKKGQQTIEFTPRKVGTIPWSCWMGMLHGEFEVVDAPAAVPIEKTQDAPAAEASSTRAADSEMAGYIVRPGDTLARIAAKLYGDRKRWPDIASANPGMSPRRLHAGQRLKLPESVGREGSAP